MDWANGLRLAIKEGFEFESLETGWFRVERVVVWVGLVKEGFGVGFVETGGIWVGVGFG